MGRPECDGEVRTLKGQLVLFTGKTTIAGQHWLRPDLSRRAQQLGASVLTGSRNRRVTLLVVGELPETVADPILRRTQNLVFVENERTRGNHICIVGDDGLERLFRGESTPCLRTRIVDASTVEVSSPGPREPRLTDLVVGRVGVHESTGLEMDLAGLDRGTQAHQDTLARLIAYLAPTVVHGISAPRVDAAWIQTGTGSLLHIAEVKSLTGAHEEQQIRLGIGQLLDYAHQIRSFGPRWTEVMPVLVLDREPRDARWLGLTAALGILLSWAPDFDGVARNTT